MIKKLYFFTINLINLVKKRKKLVLAVFICIVIVGGLVFYSIDRFYFDKKTTAATQSSTNKTQQPKKTDTKTEKDYILTIDKLKIQAPININIDGANADAYNKSLETGVAHLASSSLPGKTGNSFIFGHSSYYAWKPGNYKTVFASLNQLQIDDEIQINSNLKNYIFKVSEKKIVLPNEVNVADQNFDGTRLTLSTCWPVGSNAKRLIIISDLSSEKDR